MKTSKKLKASLAVLALSLTVSAPARADRVLCDGNLLCLAVAVPVLLTGVAIEAAAGKLKGVAAPKVDRGEVGELEQLLRDKPGLARDPVAGHALLVNAAATGDLGITRQVVEQGAVPSADHSSALGAATSANVAAYLIVKGAVPAEVDLADVSVYTDHPYLPELVTRLLDARGALAANDPGALSLMHSAALHSRPDVVELLLARGVDPNGGTTSVLLTVLDACAFRAKACGPKEAEIARAVISRGANPKAVDPASGRTALEIARQRNYRDLTKILEEAGG